MNGLKSCAALVALALLGAFAVACSSEGTTADDYRAEADLICKAAKEKIGSQEGATDPQGAVAALSTALEPLSRQIDGLEALTPPGELAADHNEALDLLREQESLVQELVRRSPQDGGEDPVAVAQEIVPRLQGLAARSDAKATDLGLVECGRGEPAVEAEALEQDAVAAREQESPLRELFRTNFVTSCSQLYPAPSCNCIVDEISAAHESDDDFIAFAERADANDPEAVAMIAEFAGKCSTTSP